MYGFRPQTGIHVLAQATYVALVLLRQDVDYCLPSKAMYKKAGALKEKQLLVRRGKTVLDMVRKERLVGTNPLETDGVYRPLAAGGAFDELCITQNFRSWFGPIPLVLEVVLHDMALEAREQAWRLRHSTDLDDALKLSELSLYLVRD